MKTVTLTAHFDGEHIQLDQPFKLPSNARLLVTIVPDPLVDAEREEWYAFSKAGLARAYSDDEPDYSAIPGSKLETDFICPNALQLVGIGLSNDAQTPA